MRVVLRGLKEELVTVSQMMLCTRCRRSERRLNTIRMCQFESTIHLIGRDVIEALALILLRQRLPIEFRSLQQRQRTHHVGLGKGEGIFDGTVHVTLCSEVDDAINLLVLHQLVEGIEVADIHLHELVVGFVLDVLEVS